MRYKLCKFCENRARDTPLWGVYIPHFGQIWVKKISILGVLHPCRCTGGGEIWHGGDLLLPAKFHPHRCNMSPLRGEKPQNRPLSKLNTGRFALRAMLPVNIMSASPTQGGHKEERTRMWADAQRDGHPAEYSCSTFQTCILNAH